MIPPGEMVGGKYLVIRVLGTGGMGTVYEAEHAAIGRRVAVKVLHSAHGADVSMIVRFEREARAAAFIGHPNIVEVIDFGIHEGRPFFVMELLLGESLAARLAHGPMRYPDACSVVRDLLSALDGMHAKGIVHCDVEPENVFLSLSAGGTDRRDVVKLLDFGISKFALGYCRSDGASRQGELLGTPGYMSPEQWMGRAGVDPRADVFSTGVLLFELLTATLPFHGGSDGETLLELLGTSVPPDPPSVFAPEIPAALDAIVLRSIERAKEARFQTAADFRDALEEFVNARPSRLLESPSTARQLDPAAGSKSRRRRSPEQKVTSWSHRPPGATAAAFIAAAVVSAVVLSLGLTSRVVRAPQTRVVVASRSPVDAALVLDAAESRRGSSSTLAIGAGASASSQRVLDGLPVLSAREPPRAGPTTAGPTTASSAAALRWGRVQRDRSRERGSRSPATVQPRPLSAGTPPQRTLPRLEILREL